MTMQPLSDVETPDTISSGRRILATLVLAVACVLVLAAVPAARAMTISQATSMMSNGGL